MPRVLKPCKKAGYVKAKQYRTVCVKLGYRTCKFGNRKANGKCPRRVYSASERADRTFAANMKRHRAYDAQRPPSMTVKAVRARARKSYIPVPTQRRLRSANKY